MTTVGYQVMYRLVIDAEAADGLWSQPTYTTLGQDTPDPISMVSCDNRTLLASSGGVAANGTDFTVTWHAAGKDEGC
jgi:hypothetical protein